MTAEATARGDRVTTERRRLLVRLEHWLEWPMLLLALVWLVLTGLELTAGLTPPLATFQQAIWVVFLLEFLLRFAVAPARAAFLRRNVVTLLALALPALRLLRIARVARAARGLRALRGLRLAKLLGSLNRGMRSLSRALRRRGFAYVLALTLLVVAGGAAGMLSFERGAFAGYGDALWWTAMLITTLGSDYWPRTPEGRVLALVLATYAFTVFGYITATLASFFVERDSEERGLTRSGLTELAEIRGELTALRTALRERDGGPRGP